MTNVRAESNPVRVVRPKAPRLRAFLRSPRSLIGSLVLAVLVGLVVAGLLLIPPEAAQQNLSRALEDPSRDHWLGTDQVGRDYLFRLLEGLRTTWLISGVGTLGGLVVGVGLGVAAGYGVRAVEVLVLRSVDLLLSVPNMVLALVIAALIGPGSTALVVALFFRALPVFVRVAHAGTRSALTAEFVQGGIVLGATQVRIVLSYVLPFVLGAAITLTPVLLGGAILRAASLSFFGLGVQPPVAELGLLVSEGRRYMQLAPLLLFAPGILLTINNIALSAVGDGLKSVLDPRQRGLIE